MELGKTGREMCPQGGDSEEKEDFKGRGTPWGVNDLSYILEAPVLWSDTGKTNALHSSEDQ